jgi:hypothetical protein
LCKIENAVIEFTKDRKTDWDSVSRAVLRTHPKCYQDVPDMIAWYKRFGGGTSKAFVPTISAMFDKFVPATRQVGGNFFLALSKLKFKADEPAPASFINSTLVVHAAAKEHDNNFAKLFKLSELDSISVGGKKHALAMLANAALLRALQLGSDTGLPTHMWIHARFHIMDRLVRLVFKHDVNKEVKEVDQAFTTIDAINAAFVAELMQMACTQGALPSASSSTEVPDISKVSTSIVEYDSSGNPIAQGKETLLAKGFDVGKFVYLYGGKTDQQWELTDINPDGMVTLVRLDDLGSQVVGDSTQWNIHDFMRKYRLCKDKIEVVSDYPAIDATLSDEFHIFNYECVVGNCLHALAMKHKCLDFEVIAKPVKKVYSTKAHAVGSLVLVPATNKITYEKNPRTTGIDSYSCVLVDEDDSPTFTLSKPQGVKYTAIIWRCKIDHDRSKCNLEVVRQGGPYKPPMNERAKMRTTSMDCVVNFKKIEVGAELVIFKTQPLKPIPKAKAVVATLPKSGQPPAKKARAS